MRAGLLRGVAASALALAVVLPGTALPARATDGTAPIQKVGTTVLNFFQRYAADGLTPQEIMQLVNETVGAVNDAEDAVVVHVDSLAAAPWLGAARAHIIEYDDILVFDEETMEDWAQDLTRDAETASSVFNAVSDRQTADHLGHVMHTLYPMSLVARSKAGFGTTRLMESYRGSLNSIVDKLRPQCSSQPGDIDPHPSVYLVEHRCLTPNGSHVMLRDYQINGTWVEGPYTAESLIAEAGRGTSWSVARAVLATMP